MDSFEYSVVLVDLDAGEGEVGFFSNSPIPVVFETNTYLPAPSIELDPAGITGDFTRTEYTIKRIPTSIPIASALASNAPYSKISVCIREVFYDMTDTEVGMDYLYRGFVYGVESKRSLGLLDLKVKDHKYYTDTTAGIACTELCAAPYFGDDNYCRKAVTEESHVIDSVNGSVITLTTPPNDPTTKLFNQGHIAFGAQRIKIKYHETGASFQMARPVPLSWAGQSVTLVSGCDKLLTTCRTIHNNESRFMGLGIAMVGYNPLYENPS